jgi:hypothetical protein
MSEVVIAALAVACVLTAVEGLVLNLGKWRGLIAIILSSAFSYFLGVELSRLIIYSLAVTFLGLTLSLMVEQLFSQPNARTLPQRISSRDLPNRP